MLLSWQFQLAFAKHYGRGLLHWYPGHSPIVNLIENCWVLKACSNSNSISSPFHFIPFHPIPFYSHATSHSNSDHLSLKCHSSQTNWPILMRLASITCIFQALLYDTCRDIQNRSINCWITRSRRYLKLLSVPHCTREATTLPRDKPLVEENLSRVVTPQNVLF